MYVWNAGYHSLPICVLGFVELILNTLLRD